MRYLKIFISALLSLLMLVTAVSCATDGTVTDVGTTAGSTTQATTTGKSSSDGNDTSNGNGNNTNNNTNNNSNNKTDLSEIEDILDNKFKLRFGDDGEFRVLVIADIHLNSSGMSDTNEERVKTLIDREKPDLIILTGDQVHDSKVKNDQIFSETIGQLADILEEEKIPWMHVYGNHDADGGYSKENQQDIYEEYNYCISKAGDEDLTGVGNYVIPLYASDSDDIKFAFWGLDSGSNMSAADKAALNPVTSTFGGYTTVKYDYIHEDQIEWYYNTSKLLEEYNNGKVPGLMAFHIPLQEYWTAWQNRNSLEYTGEKLEDICASSYNSGLFGIMRLRGDIKAVVTGHDHKNDFMVNYGGIKLCYSPSFSDSAYGNASTQGARVFVIKEDDPSNVDTYVSYIIERETPTVVGPLPTGYTYDFEGTAPTFTTTGFNGATTTEADVTTIKASVVSGVGVGGSNALAVTRTVYNSTKGGNNLEVKWNLDTAGTLGENKYLVVWMDLSTNNIDFRKACFGLIANGATSAPYRTDDHDVSSPFYYKADGSNTWVPLSTGADGCFGAGDGISVQGYKGWFAFPIEYMPNAGGSTLNANSKITGFYFYMSLSSSSMAGKYVYIDNLMLVKDYSTL